jgi:hypothetical protein
MIAQSFPSVLRLRILVLALGEAHMSGWWKTQFLSVTGLSYLNRLYPRSSFAAAVRSASRAAKAAHDSSIGVGNVFHLFRLPQQHERRLEEFVRAHGTDLPQAFEPMLNQREQLLKSLDDLGGVVSPTARGPLRLGTLADLQTDDWIAACASAYAAAFRDGSKVFPYFEAKKTIA